MLATRGGGSKQVDYCEEDVMMHDSKPKYAQS
jgi:hypothetical protein